MSRVAASPSHAIGLVALALVLLFTNVEVFAQELVPNGDFEQYYGCPDYTAQIDSAVHWFDPTDTLEGSPDYYNECSTSQFADVPLNWLSYQQARSGSAYAGLIAYYIPWLSEFREYVEVGLLAPLVQDSCYRFSMYVNLARLGNYATEDIGVYFSDTAIVGVTHDEALPFVPQVTNSTGFITDTLGWTEVSGLYQAHGAENFITIGNFQNDSTTSLMYVDSTLNFMIIYFYIDDVSLTPVDCSVGIDEDAHHNAIRVFPNPTAGPLSVSGLRPNALLTVLDLSGRIVLHNRSALNYLDIGSLTDGVYLIRWQDDKGIQLTRVVLQK
ncbi:MAG: T9SS type A sorting domain-containing protein [Flavobacteriales bacterium]|nr:T9SS type A sorting domain-containing protein [Flavobacteriales bacterium]